MKAMKGFRGVRVFGEVEGQDRRTAAAIRSACRSAQSDSARDRYPRRVPSWRIVLGRDIDRDPILRAIEFASQECLVVRGVVPGCHAREVKVSDSALQYSSAFTVSGELMMTLSSLSTVQAL
jgi:hypothetical protein